MTTKDIDDGVRTGVPLDQLGEPLAFFFRGLLLLSRKRSFLRPQWHVPSVRNQN